MNNSAANQLMDMLFDLYLRLSSSGGNPGAMNVLEAYHTFVNKSTSGRKCTYALKTQSLFFKKDYAYIRDKVFEITEIINQLENRK